jgi:uncharacterized membrane protein (UPF0127 family)
MKTSMMNCRRGACRFAIAAVIAASGFALGATNAAEPPTPASATQPATRPATEKLAIGGEEFELEIANTPQLRELGLMNRDHIDDHGGMLFIYPYPQVLSYWMKSCPIEMDILFVNDKGVIVATHRMLPAPPMKRGEAEDDYDARLPRYDSRRPAQFAIELQAGSIERLKIKPGDRIEMDVSRLTKLAAAD